MVHIETTIDMSNYSILGFSFVICLRYSYMICLGFKVVGSIGLKNLFFGYMYKVEEFGLFNI